MNRSSYNWTIHSNCGDVNNLCSISHQCNFTRTVLECIDDDGFINYIQFTYCNMQSEPFSTILLVFLLIMLFFAIGTNADDFLCPLLISISKSLKLSDNIAGVTFLAFGNGAPDIFSSIIGITNASPNLVIGQLYGAGIFVTTVVVGSILLQKPFEIMKRPLLRDILFYLTTTTLVWSTFLARKILLTHSIIFIITYSIYVIVVIVSGYIYKRRQRSLKAAAHTNHAIEYNGAKMPRENLHRQTKYVVNKNDNDETTNTESTSNSTMAKKNFVDAFEGVVLRRIKHRQYCQDPTQQRRLTLYHLFSDPTMNERMQQTQKHEIIHSITVNDNNNNNIGGEVINKPNQFYNNNRRITISDTGFAMRHPSIPLANNGEGKNLAKFLQKILICNKHIDDDDEKEQKQDVIQASMMTKIMAASRIDYQVFRESNLLAKINMIIKAPIYLIYTITIPVVDNELPKQGWIRQLNLAHLIISPQICLFIIQIKFMEPYQLHLIVLAISSIIFILVMCTSQTDKPPRYHILFAYFGFIVSISWIYTIATEVVNILDAIRVIFNLSKFMIGLTIGAWGNSIGDFLSNLSMAKNGFPRMAISACFGGPVLNMLLGIGIPYTILFIRQQTYQIDIEYNNMITVLYVTITISLMTTTIILLAFTKFQSSRLHGLILYGIYGCFLVTAIITEMKLI
ncbi:mitochondrial sodium/calcium exchanger protein [Dermatophagoides farinae]|uniref:mitochondrial sodium/calcium exchanger protein n=1 Tax=Dermatophagoides farinae TaxID=6954 RepID=UPI003F6100FD